MTLSSSTHDAWARLRFSVIGPLLAAPPPRGQLGAELEKLTQKLWRHPLTGKPLGLAFSTLERWYYAAKNESQDPVGVLRQKVRKDAGQNRTLSLPLRTALRAQYEAHPAWSYRLHADNLVALVLQQPQLGPTPSYPTVRRWMKSQGMFRRKRLRPIDSPGAQQAQQHLAQFEVRSYEVAYVDGLWHADLHVCSRPVLLRDGSWVTPHLFAALDDHSRLLCHAQWYLTESAETFVHGLSQAIQKRGLPRSLMTDRGSAMAAAEVQEGLSQLGILHQPTLPYSPYQNAKMEVVWASIEGRLMAMLETVRDLGLESLNQATQAYVELEYNRAIHSEMGASPLSRYLQGPSVGRESPDSLTLQRAFRMTVCRTQRRSDGTICLEGVRFEIPSRYRTLERVTVRLARWDLSLVDLVDPRTKAILCALWVLDKTQNADGQRRALEVLAETPQTPAGEVAPLLKNLLAEYAATGLPPAYLPHHPQREEPR